MPELPEVTVVSNGLRDLIVGGRIKAVRALSSKSLMAADATVRRFLEGATIVAVERRGKIIIVNLDNDYSFAIHLKMSGQLVYRGQRQEFGGGHPSPSLVADLPDKTTRVIFDLEPKAQLFFNDGRHFGWVKVCPTILLDETVGLDRLGPDALSISTEQMVGRLRGRKKTIKACLLDQTILAGCGNIYADESLFVGQIHPATPAGELSRAAISGLLTGLKQVLRLSIKQGGSSLKDYVDSQGKPGRYLDFAYVYRRTDQPCRVCSTAIARIRLAGRSTHYCPRCQSLSPESKVKKRLAK